jgi:ribonuclease HII
MPRLRRPEFVPEWPTLEFENRLWRTGLTHVAGVDEVGRGALAGPVYVGAVILPMNDGVSEELSGVRDSKMMSPEEREFWVPIIQETAIAYGLGWASCKEIDRWGIAPATRMAAKRALNSLSIRPEHVLLDYISLSRVDLPQTSMAAGDALCLSVAAASVLAKVARDAKLCELDSRFPKYGFASHKGYYTDDHVQAIKKHGPCAQHRQSFAPVRKQ